jgi:hypothetical protein
LGADEFFEGNELLEGSSEERADVLGVIFWAETAERYVDDKTGQAGTYYLAQIED